MNHLEVKDISIDIETRRGSFRAVDRLSFGVNRGEALGIVGESGCGKSLTSLAVMGLLPDAAKMAAGGGIFIGDKRIDTLKESERRKMRGSRISMIFQDPMTSLNPSFRVEYQIAEAIKLHTDGYSLSKIALRERCLKVLHDVGIPSPEERLRAYPHQLSGGMSQRVMIAMALACNPEVLIADEPTTALDVTIQAQILDLLSNLQKTAKLALVLITHDMSVIKQATDRLLVMYAGQMVESGKTQDLLKEPSHPYTKGLLACIPSLQPESLLGKRLPTIGGTVPDLIRRPKGCLLSPRCPSVLPKCLEQEAPVTVHGKSPQVRCHLYGDHSL